MKKKALLSSILVIALCISIIAGSTLALFTDTTEFNIAATSGDVEIDAFATINAIYSAKGADVAEDEFLVDENGNSYVHDLKESTFTNGGVANLDGASLKIDRLTPGDRVDVNVNVTNTSDVAIAYRYIIKATESNLAYGMVVTDENGNCYEGLESYTSDWYGVIPAPDGKAHGIPVKTFSFELPVYAGNEFQTENAEGKIESVEYTITVEAVQGNAVTHNDTPVTIFPAAFAKMINERDVVTTNGATVVLESPINVRNNTCTIVNSVIDARKLEDLDGGDVAYAMYMTSSNITLDNTVIYAPALDIPNSFCAGIIGENVNTLTMKNGSKIVVPEGSDTYAIQVQNSGGDFTVVFEESGMVNGPVLIATWGESNIYVPTEEAYFEYNELFNTDSVYKTVNWYINGVLVPVVTSENATDLLTDPNTEVVRFDKNVSVTVEAGAVISNKIIDVNGNDVKIDFSTATMNNVVIMGINDTNGEADSTPINLSGVTGNVTIVDSVLTDVSGGKNGAILLGENVNLTVENTKFYGIGKSYAIYDSGASGSIYITGCTFENFGSWAIMVNNTVKGDLVVDGCTFNTPDGVLKTLAGGVTGNFTFTNNTMIGCKGHDGNINKLVVSGTGTDPVKCGGIKTVTGNTLDGVEWTQQ